MKGSTLPDREPIGVADGARFEANNERNLADTYSPWDPRNKRATVLLGIALTLTLALPAMFAAISMLATEGYSPYLLFWFFLLAIPTVPLHELIHAVFQWLFSKKRPQLGFRFPYPYSALRPGASMSRNEGVLSALSPFLLVSSALIPMPFMNQAVQAAIVILVYLHTPTCSGDFHFTFWLLAHRKESRLRVEGHDTVLFGVKNR